MTWAHIPGSQASATDTTGPVASIAVTAAAAPTVGHLCVVCIASTNNNSTSPPTPTVTDQLGNTWTLGIMEDQPAIGSNYQVFIYYSVITQTGTPVVTIAFGNGTANQPQVTFDEYSFTAGTISVASTAVNGGATTTGTLTTGNTTFTVPLALGMMAVQFPDGPGTFTAGTGFTIRNSPTFNSEAEVVCMQDWLNVSSSPITSNSMVASFGAFAAPWNAASIVFQSSGDGPSFTVSPSTHANAASVTYTLTGSGTSWVSGTTTFGISGVTGASITSQSCTSSTAGSVTVLLDNTHTGTLTFTDSVDSATATSGVTLAAPGVPTSPLCTPGNAQNVVSWSAPSSGGLPATYTLLRGTTSGGETSYQTGISALNYTDTGVVNGTTYYKIEAVNGTGTSAASSEVSGTPSAGALVAGTASTVSVGNTIATVTVTAATGGTSPYTYQWYRSTTSGFTPGGGNIVAGATSLTLNDTGLTNGTTYYYVNVVTDSA